MNYLLEFSRRLMQSTASPETAASAIPSPTTPVLVSPAVSTCPSVISQISAESATQVTTVVGNLNTVGRGIVARMRSLQVSSTTVIDVPQPVAREPQEVYARPILTHQENAPIVKKGEMGTKYVFSKYT